MGGILDILVDLKAKDSTFQKAVTGILTDGELIIIDIFRFYVMINQENSHKPDLFSDFSIIRTGSSP
jgi:hypothetical protein